MFFSIKQSFTKLMFIISLIILSTFSGCSNSIEQLPDEQLPESTEDDVAGVRIKVDEELGIITVVGDFAEDTISKIKEQLINFDVINLDMSGLKGFEVIDDEAFKNCNNLSEVKLPEGVRKIGKEAFYGCLNLKSINIPTSLESVDEDAFYVGYGVDASNVAALDVYISDLSHWCSVSFASRAANPLIRGIYGGHLYLNNVLVTELVIPDGITSIGDMAFYGCSFSKICLPPSVEIIGKLSFGWNKQLTSVDFSDGLISIGEEAFFGCDNLVSSITIPASLESIGRDAFCDKNYNKLIKSVYITDIASWCKLDDGACFSTAELYFNGEVITALVIPEGVTVIRADAFSNCKSITSVQFSTTVKEVKANALREGNIERVYISDISSWCGIEFESFYDNPLSWNALLYLNDSPVENEIVIPEGTTNICKGAFYNIKNLTNIVIPEGVVEIGEAAFMGCEKLNRIVFPDSVTNIGSSAFKNCVNLIDVDTGDGVSVEEHAFENCQSLKNISSLIVVGDYAFANCRSLSSISVQANIGDFAFENCKKLSEVVLYYSRSIGRNSFSNCTSLIKFEFPYYIERIGACIFKGCSNLEEVKFARAISSSDGWYDDTWYLVNQSGTSATPMIVGDDNDKCWLTNDPVHNAKMFKTTILGINDILCYAAHLNLKKYYVSEEMDN